jgi:hypothetical protein
MIKQYNRALGAKGKQANLASLDGNAPLSVAGATTSPGGGSLLSAQLPAILVILNEVKNLGTSRV